MRAEFPYIDEDYTAYLLQSYDHTYYPERMINAGKAVHIERNCEMIDNSGYCIIYYDENYPLPKSGTKLAYDYVVKNNIRLVNAFC